jgi:MFS transporter, putative metabolite:H+ symporter
VAESPVSEQLIIARLERLPFSSWHARILTIVGAANFFDAFDTLTIAVVLPALVPLWQLQPQEIGFLISMGFLGQLLGAVAFSFYAERLGRLVPLRWTLWIISALSLACAAAWSYPSFLIFRALQGLGLGAENPIASAYINEMARAQLRGRLAFGFQAIFSCAIFCTSLVSLWVVPHWGWQWMFVIGALPAFLAAWLRRLVPESPRWLASIGRLDEADRVVANIEKEASRGGAVLLPPVPTSVPLPLKERVGFMSLFERGYAARTLLAWLIMFCASTVSYGLLVWMPTIYRTVFKLPLETTLQYAFISSTASVTAALTGVYIIDRVPRRALFVTCLAGAAIPLVVLGFIQDAVPVQVIVAFATFGIFSMSYVSNAVYVYIPETYPTRMRAFGSGVASASLRIASIVGPYVVGLLLATANLGAVFEFFGLTALFGAVAVFLFAIETRGRVLEEIAH